VCHFFICDFSFAKPSAIHTEVVSLVPVWLNYQITSELYISIIGTSNHRHGLLRRAQHDEQVQGHRPGCVCFSNMPFRRLRSVQQSAR
jgi:hypothetical protein